MPTPLFLRLRNGAKLTGEDLAPLEDLCDRQRSVPPRKDIIREGGPPGDVCLVLDGIACRHRALRDGHRAIVALMLPGDISDPHVSILGRIDYGVSTITACTLVDIPRQAVKDLTEHHPRIALALWWATLVDEGILREWLVNVGRRPAAKRAAHFFCEILTRLHAVGAGESDGCTLPLTQQELADILGLSTVHVNRTLQMLREAGLCTLTNRRLGVPDPDRLRAFADFSADYLHLS